MKYRLFECCRLVVGYGRSCIYDLQRDKHIFIPNGITGLFNDNNVIDSLTIGLYDKFSQKNISSFINSLIKEEYLFEIEDNELQNFPKMDLTWAYPAHITNAILVLNNFNYKFYKNILSELLRLNCVNIQFLIFSRFESEKISEIQHYASNVGMKYFEYVINASNIASEAELLTWRRNNSSISKIVVTNSDYNKIIQEGEDTIIITKEKIDNSISCGNIHPYYFCRTIECFTEAQCHNTCLNRKVCIDANGDIKNCPAMAKSYGNIKDTTLEEAINKPGFKDLWFINKDKIDVCKDCEFRYMCTDCRAFIKDPENIYSQPAKCTYNPYICLWEGQEGYVPVEECGTYSRETGFVPDKKKIKALNKKIWGEE